MEIYPHCTSETFKTNLSELCKHCPLRGRIAQNVKEFIDVDVKEQKNILSDNQFKKYIDNEVRNAREMMNKTLRIERTNKHYKTDPHRGNRINNYILRKEQIKALNLLEQVKEVFPKYCEIGSFFAQDKIFKVKEDYCYENESFKSPRKLELYLRDNILKEEVSVRQYIADTCNNRTTRDSKNIFNNQNIMEKIIKYCEINQISISDSFLSKYNDLSK